MSANLPPDWTDLQLLAEVVAAGSLLAVARRRVMAVSTLSRRMSRLEGVLGCKLIDRGPKGVVLRESALGLVGLTRDFEMAVAAAVRALPAHGRVLRGTLRLSAGDGFATLLSAVVAEFSKNHPEVRFELALEDRLVDLPRREADVALRTVHRREPSLVYRSVGQLDYGLFAERRLLARTGSPRRRADLAKLPVIGLAAPLDRAAPQSWLMAQVAPVLRANTFAGQLAATHAGVGLAALPVASATGLDRVLSKARLPGLPVWLVTRATFRTEPHVAAFARALAARFEAEDIPGFQRPPARS